MSMISGQINELRAMAQLEKSLERPAIARILGDAADTIWQLRDDLQRANAENAKLREDNDRLIQAVEDLHDVSLEDRLVQLENENAKLRELAVLNWEWAHSCCGNNCKMKTDDCGYQIDRDCNYEREIYDRMRELGVEVDE